MRLLLHKNTIRKDIGEENRTTKGTRGKGKEERRTGQLRDWGKVSILATLVRTSWLLGQRWTQVGGQKHKQRNALTRRKWVRKRERQWEKIWEWVGNTTPNTFSIMSQHAWQDSGTRDNIQIKLQGKRTVQLLQMCRHPSALDSAPPPPPPSQSVARQMWSHLPFAKSLCSICWLERRRREGVHNESSILFEKALTK